MKIAFIILVFFPLLVFAETVYVHSQKTSLKAEPTMSGKDLEVLHRGEELSVLEMKGPWFKVKKGTMVGWVSKLFVNKNKPVGAAELANEVTASDAKVSRRRESSYSVSASARGLMPTQRSRNDRESYQADSEALQKINSRVVNEKEVETFVKKSEPGR